MTRALTFLFAGPLLAVLAGACDSGPPPSPSGAAAPSKAPAALPNSPASASTVKLGAPIGRANVVPLASITSNVARYAKTIVTTEGKVTAVCQAMGCWMEIAEANGTAHIKMSGHSFFVPKSASGRRAIVQGTVLPKPDDGECEQEAEQATGRAVKVELEATGVELL